MTAQSLIIYLLTKIYYLLEQGHFMVPEVGGSMFIISEILYTNQRNLKISHDQRKRKH